MDDRRGRGGDAMRHRPFASAQERVFDGGGAGPSFGGDFDQGSSYMELLSAGVNPQPPPPLPQWAVEEMAAAPAINLVPQSFSTANFTSSSSSYQHPASFAAVSPLSYSTQPYAPLYLQQTDLPPTQWHPRPAIMSAASSYLPPNFSFLPAAAHNNQLQQHVVHPRGGAGGQPSPAVIEQPAKDGYSWRKYGQKQLKDAESPRSYYKCTREGCPVKKVVERSFDGFITEITYKGRHNHPRPPQRGNDGDVPAGIIAEEALDGQSDHDDDEDVLHEDHDGDEGHRAMGADGTVAGQRVVKKPKIILQTPSDVDLLDDGYRWRKYGQKVVKGNPRPRSYYKCTADNCNVRKQIERASTDPRCVLTTYAGRHNHDPPGQGPDAAAAPGGASAHHPAAAGGSGMFQQTGGSRQLKEES